MTVAAAIRKCDDGSHKITSYFLLVVAYLRASEVGHNKVEKDNCR